MTIPLFKEYVAMFLGDRGLELVLQSMYDDYGEVLCISYTVYVETLLGV
jgi:hypothetical protein